MVFSAFCQPPHDRGGHRRGVAAGYILLINNIYKTLIKKRSDKIGEWVKARFLLLVLQDLSAGI